MSNGHFRRDSKGPNILNNKTSAIALLSIKENPHFVEPYKEPLLLIKEFPITPKHLTIWLFKLHKQHNLTPQLEFVAYLRGAKKVIDRFGKKKTRYLLRELETEVMFEHPFTFKFVCEWFEANDFEIEEKKVRSLSLL